MKKCECGENLTGHEDESSTKCRWCVSGWTPRVTHTESANCECGPTVDFVTEDGTTVYAHHKAN